MISFLVDCAIKSTIILAVASVIAFWLRQKSASLRHCIWTAAIVAIVLLPGLAAVLPTSFELSLATVPHLSGPLVLSESQNADVIDMTAGSVDSSSASSAPSILVGVWLFGLTSMAAVLFIGAARFGLFAYKSQPFFDVRWFRMIRELCGQFGLKRPVRLVQSRSASMLVTWGNFEPRVLVPAGAENWTDHRVRAVLGHELAHVQRHDWFVQLISEIARTIYWFNPLVWYACKRLRQEAERACDDAVLRLGMDSTEYATELLSLARMLKTSSCSWTPSPAMARPSTLERRFAAMLNPLLDRRTISRKAALVVGLLALSVTLPLAAMRGPAQTQTGRLLGRVYDPSGAPVRNATVSVFNSATNSKEMTTTNASGVFEFLRLPAGRYELRTTATGFEPFQISEVTVDANQEMNVNVLAVATAPVRAASPGISESRQAATTPAGTVRPRLLQRVQPVYPESLKEQRIQGAVILSGVIGTDGVPKDLKVTNAAIDPELAKAAVDAVKQWRYEPATSEGRPVEASTQIAVNFAIPAQPAVVNSGLVAGQNAAAPSSTPSRVRVGGNVQIAKLISQMPPVYPREAKEQKIQGVVVLETVIGRTGLVESVRVISGHPYFHQSATDAVRQWRYQETLLNGEPVEVVTTVTVSYSFQQ